MPLPTFGQLSETRRNNFDFLRFFFASLVIFSHSFILLGSNADEPGARLTQMRWSFGSLSVACFFGISGYLITQSWLRSPNLGDYFKKRALRIYPGWIAALLIGVFVFAPLLRPSHGLELGRSTLRFLDQLWLHRLGGVQDLPEVGTINGSTWTIPFEFLCYFLVAGLGLFGLFRRRMVILLLTFALLVCVQWPPQTILKAYGPTFPRLHVPYFGDLKYLPLLAVYFLSGMLFFLYRDRIPHSPWLFALSLALVGLTLGRLPLAPLLFAIFPTAGFYALFYLAFLPVGSLHDWAKHGDLSYGVYLYAWPFQRLLISEQFRGYHLSPLTLFGAAWALSVGAAALSWRLVERPALRLEPRPPGPPAEDAGVPAASGAGAQPA